MVSLPGWLKRRQPDPPAASPPAPPLTFDAVISVGPYNLPQGLSPNRAIAVIRQAVQAMPGAGWISVEHHPVGTADGSTEVFPAGSCANGSEDLRLQVEAVVSAAIASIAPVPDVSLPRVPAAAPDNPFSEPAAAVRQFGFSDGQNFRLRPASKLSATRGEGIARTGAGSEQRGLRSLTDAELLTHLLNLVVPSGAEVAGRAVARFGSFAAVLSAPEIELRKLPGLGTHSIAAIKLLQAAALRLSRAAIMDQPFLDGTDGLINYLTAVLARESIEHFRILFLDGEGRLRADEAQARGTVNHTPVYPREVVRRALELQAASIILVHNHPSGDPSPSQDDFEMTTMIEEAAEVVGLVIQDHIIVGNGRWLSFRSEGFLSPRRRQTGLRK
jgi:DNA repair protein RadC